MEFVGSGSKFLMTILVTEVLPQWFWAERREYPQIRERPIKVTTRQILATSILHFRSCELIVVLLLR